MATTIEDLKRWYEEAKREGATHLIIVCDTFDYEDFPVKVTKKQDVSEVMKNLMSPSSMNKIMEVYSMKKDFDKQATREVMGRPLCWDLT